MTLRDALDEGRAQVKAAEDAIEQILVQLAVSTGCAVREVRVEFRETTALATRRKLTTAVVSIELVL